MILDKVISSAMGKKLKMNVMFQEVKKGRWAVNVQCFKQLDIYKKIQKQIMISKRKHYK